MLGALVATRHRIADALARHALAMPETWEDHPWEGDRVAKVRKKIFAFLPSDGLGKPGWVTVRIAETSCPDAPLLTDWIEESYATVAPKTLVARMRIEREH
jgi:predicted DNA-binding protein (MmcQ/YjbR family)